MKRWIRRFALAGVLLFAGIQFVPVQRTNPPVKLDISAPTEVEAVLRRSCYDCHSHETRWPWYGYVAPLSWWITDHVREGRGDLNFSDWPAFDTSEQEHLLGEIAEEVAEGEMPLPKYLYLHPRARLSDAERDLLVRWAGGVP